VDERFRAPRRRQAVLARRALPDAAEPHLPRRDRSQGPIPPWRTHADRRSAVVERGPGSACQQPRRAELGHTKSPTQPPCLQISEFPTGDFGSNRQAVSVETDRPFRSKAAPRCEWVLVPALANRRCVIILSCSGLPKQVLLSLL